MDKLWFYTKSGSTEKQGPVAEAELRNLVSSGAITAQDLLWTDGMKDWLTLNAIPELRSGVPAVPSMAVRLPEGLTGWLGFVAIMNIITGILMAISCVGLLTGVLTIIAGTSLLAAKNTLVGMETVDASLAPFFDKLKTFVQMTGVVFIISLVGGLIGLILWFSMFAAVFAGAMGAS